MLLDLTRVFFQFLHGSDDERLGVLDLLHDQAHIHRRILRLPGAAAVDTVLAHKSQGISQDIERGSEPATHGPHLEFITFFGFAIVIQHRFAYARYSSNRSARSTSVFVPNPIAPAS